MLRNCAAKVCKGLCDCVCEHITAAYAGPAPEAEALILQLRGSQLTLDTWDAAYIVLSQLAACI